jgi:hypothetical protein
MTTSSLSSTTSDRDFTITFLVKNNDDFHTYWGEEIGNTGSV